MKVWVTGADGQVGRSLRAIVSPDEAAGYLFLKRQHLDITDADAIQTLAELTPPSCIVNLAAYTRVDQAESEPDEAMRVNGYAVKLLAQIAERYQVPLIHMSTDYVFDGAKMQPYSESDVANPINVYGHTKLAGEQFIQSFCSQYIIIRTSWVFSEFDGNFLTTMLRLGKERDKVAVVTDQIGGPTYAGDIARLIKQLIGLPRPQSLPWGIVHFSGGPFVSWATFATEIFFNAVSQGLLKRAPTVIAIGSHQYPTAARRPRNSRIESRLPQDGSVLISGCRWYDGLRIAMTRLS